MQTPLDDDLFDEYLTIIPVTGERDPQVARWRAAAERACEEQEQERETAPLPRLRISRMLLAFGRGRR